ncbi:MAG: AtpZ/AtpI family protein [Anaerolineaceae bacterium]|nr:AtpZ/AtpI family protein [Anaerolineaceae bacterium]
MNNQNSTKKNVMRMAGVSLSAGCLTLVIAGLFVLAGLLIDRSAGTGPRWMLILLFVSLPFSLGVSYLVARRAIKKAKAETAAMVDEGEGDSSDEVNGI